MAERLIQVGDYVSVRGKGRYTVIAVRPSKTRPGLNSPSLKEGRWRFYNPDVCKILTPLNLENE